MTFDLALGLFKLLTIVVMCWAWYRVGLNAGVMRERQAEAKRTVERVKRVKMRQQEVVLRHILQSLSAEMMEPEEQYRNN